MFKIGAFSNLVNVSPRMLRYYEKCGLIFPMKIDKTTGNRYYSASQIPLLESITSLRDMGFNVAEIGDIIDNYTDKAYVESMISQKSIEIKNQMSELQVMLSRVENMNLSISDDTYVNTVEVVTKSIPSYKVVSLRKTLPSYSEQNSLWVELFAYIQENNLQPVLTNKLLCIYHCPEYVEKNVDIEVCAEVTQKIETKAGFSYRETEEIPLCATAVFKGFYSDMALWEGLMAKWIEENEYEVDGCEQFYCIKHFLNCNDTNDYETELQLPIKRLKGEF